MVSSFDNNIYSTPLFLLQAKILVASLLLIFLCPITAYLQPAQYFENPIIKDAQVGYVKDAIIDKYGFLWIAGSNGLVRYDGSHFKSFSHNPKDSLSLMCNNLNDLFYNEQTNQLFMTSWNTAKGGLSIFDLESEQFKNIRFDSSNSSGLEGQGLYWTHQDKFGKYWISIKGQGMVNYFPENDSIVQFPYLSSLGENKDDKINTFLSHSMDTFNDSLLWLGTLDGGLLKFNLLSQEYTRYPIYIPGGNSIRSIYHHSDQKVYIGTWSAGVYSFDLRTSQLKKHDFEGILYDPEKYLDEIFVITAAFQNSLYVTTKAGLIEYDVKQEKVIRFKKNDFIQKTFFGSYKTDKKKRAFFWQDNNLYIFDPHRQQNKFHSYGIKEPSFDFLVRRILEDESNGKLWVAAQFSEGLYRFDPKTEEWEVFPPPKSYFKGRSDFLAWDVLKTRTGEILVLGSDTDEAIYKVLEKEKRLVPWHLQPNSSKYRRMIEDSKGNIWVGTHKDGVFRINPTTKEIRHFKKEFIHPELTGVGAAWDMKEDRNGNIWIRSKGLKVYDPRRDTVYLFPYFFPDQKAVYHISSLGIDEEGNVFAGSHEGSIGFTNADHPEKGIVEYFDKSKGLKMQKPQSFLLDEKKNIWLLNRGLEKINADRSATHLYKSSSFSTIESVTFTKLSNGTFAIGDRHGINIINPDSLKINQDLFHPYIHTFKVFDKDLNLESSLFKTTDVYLKAGENFFSLEFSALKPTFYGSAKFQYQLDGVDPDWVDPKNRRYVAYTNVESGTYDFKLKVRNNENIWNETPSVLRIHIASYWYKTWWAYALFTILTLGLFYFWYRFQLKRREEKEEALRLKELDTFKTRFYSNITHEFRTPLTVIQGMAKELKEQPQQEPEKKLNLIVKSTRSLLTLVNQMLDLSKMKAGKGKTDLKNDDVIVFLKHLVESHESYANMQQLGLQFHSEEDHLMMDFDAKKLERVLSNLLSNAIKFTPSYGKILVLVNKINSAGKPFLEIKVKDSGIGISEENIEHIFDRFHQANPIHNNQGTGIGLAMVKELVNIMSAKINVKSKINEGSTFILTLPIYNKAPLAKENEHHTFNSLPVSNIPITSEPVLSENGLPIILIIEDNIDLDYYLKSCLEGYFQTLSCRNGKEGVEKALEILPDVIISDVMMPEMDGFEVCKILKEDERSSHIPIILLTAKASTEAKIKGLTQGADAYLTKPFEKEELMIRLNKLMEVRKTLQKKYSNTLISVQQEHQSFISKEDTFIGKVEDIILLNMINEDFSINDLAQELFLSRSQVHRKIKALTGMSTSIYIRSVRLQKAKNLLSSTGLSISEIAYQCGFKSPAYFSQVFKDSFGIPPSAAR